MAQIASEFAEVFWTTPSHGRIAVAFVEVFAENWLAVGGDVDVPLQGERLVLPRGWQGGPLRWRPIQGMLRRK